MLEWRVVEQEELESVVRKREEQESVVEKRREEKAGEMDIAVFTIRAAVGHLVRR